MNIENSKDLRKKIRELEDKRNRFLATFFSTSDHTRDVAGSVQRGMYLGQLGLGVFRNLTNYHLPFKKRVFRIALNAGLVLALNFLGKKLFRKSDE